MTERQIINAFHDLCRPSVDPVAYVCLVDIIIPQLENNRADLGREVDVLDTCGICGKPIAGQPTAEDAECGTCCAEHL